MPLCRLLGAILPYSQGASHCVLRITPITLFAKAVVQPLRAYRTASKLSTFLQGRLVHLYRCGLYDNQVELIKALKCLMSKKDEHCSWFFMSYSFIISNHNMEEEIDYRLFHSTCHQSHPVTHWRNLCSAYPHTLRSTHHRKASAQRSGLPGMTHQQTVLSKGGRVLSLTHRGRPASQTARRSTSHAGTCYTEYSSARSASHHA